MKIYIDLSVLCPEGPAVGRVSGALEFEGIPPIGSSVMLAYPKNGTQPIAGFNGRMKVVDLRFEPASSGAVGVALSLEDVVVASVEEGRRVMNFLENGFGLSIEEYDFEE